MNETASGPTRSVTGSAIGIDIGGTKIFGGVVDANGTIIDTERRDTPTIGGMATVERIAEVARTLASRNEVSEVGVSLAGFISKDRKRMETNPNIANMKGLAIHDELERATGLEIHLENDANCAAWGEYRFGAGRGANPMMMITVGTGIGGGLIIDGKLLIGAFGTAGEMGHVPVVPNGEICGCGMRGCLEQYASGNALRRYVTKAIEGAPALGSKILSLGDGTISGIEGPQITTAARQGDAIALQAFNEIGEWLGYAISGFVSMIDPACVVIGGGVIEAGELLLEPIRASVKKHSPMRTSHEMPEILAAELGNAAGIVGVADLARIA
ncbi:MAG: ROK family glucokinase [Candidatus Nanopelagicaceae bacterium]